MSETVGKFDFLTFMSNINVTLSASHIVIFVFMALMIHLLVTENRSNNIRWLDMLSQVDRHGQLTKTISLSKLLQLIGGITGTWVIIVYTIKQSLTAEMFFTYLAYVGAIEGWSKFVSLKYGVDNTNNDTIEPTPAPPPPKKSPKSVT